MVVEKAVSLDEDARRGLWQVCLSIPGLNADRWRYDYADMLMKWEDYGNRSSTVGWHVAYIVALGDGGADHVDNLRAVSFSADILGGRRPAK